MYNRKYILQHIIQNILHNINIIYKSQIRNKNPKITIVKQNIKCKKRHKIYQIRVYKRKIRHSTIWTIKSTKLVRNKKKRREQNGVQ